MKIRCLLYAFLFVFLPVCGLTGTAADVSAMEEEADLAVQTTAVPQYDGLAWILIVLFLLALLLAVLSGLKDRHR